MKTSHTAMLKTRGNKNNKPSVEPDLSMNHNTPPVRSTRTSQQSIQQSQAAQQHNPARLYYSSEKTTLFVRTTTLLLLRILCWRGLLIVHGLLRLPVGLRRLPYIALVGHCWCGGVGTASACGLDLRRRIVSKTLEAKAMTRERNKS
ncbi:hypothetical protein K440DRAFT_419485 [Wilcoxina mikolae CBS 423.85]|nr:hypothetical protein K440DRAFT_419485 [Wilcoxina mikolae CBS 423.85]